MKTIKATETFKIPGSDIIVKEGQEIEIQEKEELTELMKLKDIQLELQDKMKNEIPNFGSFMVSNQFKAGFLGTNGKLRGDAFRKGNTAVHIRTKAVEGTVKWKDVKKFEAEKNLKNFKVPLLNGTVWYFFNEKRKPNEIGNFYPNPFIDKFNNRTR